MKSWHAYLGYILYSSFGPLTPFVAVVSANAGGGGVTSMYRATGTRLPQGWVLGVENPKIWV